MKTGNHDRQSNKSWFGVGMGIVKDAKTGKEEKRPFFTMRVPAGTPGAKTYLKADGSVAADKDGNHLWRIETTYLEGQITGLSTRVNEEGFGDGPVTYLEIEFDKEGVLSLRAGDRYWSNFLQKLLNIDLKRPLWMTPYNFETKEGSKQVGFDIRQNPAEPRGTKVPSAFGINPDKSKFFPQGMSALPDAEVKVINRKDVYDWTARDEYLEREVLLPIKELLESAEDHAALPAESLPAVADESGQDYHDQPPPPEPAAAAAPPVEDDDLPF